MFCDLVGSTAMAARLDPEELREVIGAYHRCVAAVIERSGGFVAKYTGDGVLAYFGYPRADEHDGERAVRAGLALVDAVAGLHTAAGARLQVRLGIATGLVVVGDLIGQGAAQEQAVVGETPNLAARLQAVAAPGTVVIGPSTRRLTVGLFDYEDLGIPVEASRVLRESAAESRFEALRAARTPLVGRDEELALLQRRWQQAKSGEGSVVLVSGEPGIGKSRLAQTLIERLAGEPLTCLRLFCSHHHQDSALYPTITQLERAAGFRREDTAEQRFDKLQAVLAQATGDLGEAAPLVAALLSLPAGERYPPLNLTPQRQKERTLRALAAQVEGLAARQPVLMRSIRQTVRSSAPFTATKQADPMAIPMRGAISTAGARRSRRSALCTSGLRDRERRRRQGLHRFKPERAPAGQASPLPTAPREPPRRLPATRLCPLRRGGIPRLRARTAARRRHRSAPAAGRARLSVPPTRPTAITSHRPPWLCPGPAARRGSPWP
jgi:class 3 adenylate cyclase